VTISPALGLILSMPAQAWLFLSTVLAGAAIGVFYDVFRVLRKVTPHSAWVVQLEDVLFWITATGAMFYFMLNRNFGEIRPFVLVGTACGIAAYFATISPIVLKIAVGIVNFVKRVIIVIVRIITLPLKFMYHLMSPPIKNISNYSNKKLRIISRYSKMKVRKSVRNWSIRRKKV